jgi:hypothetical protein
MTVLSRKSLLPCVPTGMSMGIHFGGHMSGNCWCTGTTGRHARDRSDRLCGSETSKGHEAKYFEPSYGGRPALSFFGSLQITRHTNSCERNQI